MEDTGILCCFVHFMEENTFFPQQREVLLINPCLCAQYRVFPQVSEEWGKAEMIKVRNMMLWLQKKPWNLARAWVFSSGDQTRSGWLQTSSHSPPPDVLWLMLTHPSLHCWFSLGVLSYPELTSVTEASHSQPISWNRQPSWSQDNPVACNSGPVSDRWDKASFVPFHPLSARSLCRRCFL